MISNGVALSLRMKSETDGSRKIQHFKYGHPICRVLLAFTDSAQIRISVSEDYAIHDNSLEQQLDSDDEVSPFHPSGGPLRIAVHSKLMKPPSFTL